MIQPAIVAYKLTVEDWYPGYRQECLKSPCTLVKISLYKYENGLGRISVWGADDHGMERDFVRYDRAKQVFQELMMEYAITHQGLKDQGFVLA